MVLGPSRRWLRFSMRTMFVLLTVFCIWLAWEAKIMHERNAARTEIKAAGGELWPWSALAGQIGEDPLPFWRRWMGDESVSRFVLTRGGWRQFSLKRQAEIRRLFPECKGAIIANLHNMTWEQWLQAQGLDPAKITSAERVDLEPRFAEDVEASRKIREWEALKRAQKAGLAAEGK